MDDRLARANEMRARGDYAGLLTLADQAGDEPPGRRAILEAAAATALVSLGQLRAGEGRAAGALALAEEDGDPAAVAAALVALALAVRRLGASRRAEALLQRALGLYRRVRDSEGAGTCALELGAVAGRSGRLAQAERWFATAREAFVEAGDPSHEAEVIYAMAHCELIRGDLDAAAAGYGEACGRFETAGSPIGVANALNGLAGVEVHRGEFALAVTLATAGLEAARGCGFATGAESAGNLLGEAYRGLGALDQAEAAYREVLAAFERQGAEEAVVARVNLAIVAVLRGRFVEAAELVTPILGGEKAESRRLVEAMCYLVLACTDGDAAALRTAIRLLDETGEREPDVALLASMAARSSGPLAARAWALVLAHGRPDQAVAAQEALQALVGKPIPVGPFDLISRLGSGEGGEVWRARHAEDGGECAVKLLTSESPDARGALEREIATLAGLQHPNIVRVVDAGVVSPAAAAMLPALAPGTPWFAMDLVGGGTLEPWCGRLPWPHQEQAIRQVLAALAHAHAHSVLHLDLKPANVLLESSGAPLRVRLTDFGISREVGARRSARIAGTPAYMAPEQFDAGALGPWTDLYALGCTAFHLATGRVPFGGTSLASMWLAHTQEAPPDLPRSVPPRAAAWIRRLLSKKPADRFANAADALAALSGHSAASVPSGWRAAETPLARLPTGSGLALVGLRQLPLIGRTREQDFLWSSLRDVARWRRPLTVVITGSEGSGRSRLARWIGAVAHELTGARVLDLVPAATLPILAENRLTVAVFDSGDAHLEPALALSAVVRGPVLVVVVSPEPRQRAVAALLDRQDSRPDLVRLDLGPLDEASQTQLVAAMLPLRGGLAATLAARSAGNPELAVQLVAGLVQRRALTPTSEGFELRTGFAPTLAGDLRLARRARLDAALLGLPPSAAEAVVVAAVIGTVVEEELWRMACARAGLGAVSDVLRRLRVADLAAAEVRGEWRFCDVAVTEGAIELGREIGALEMANRAVAEALAEQGGPAGRVGLYYLAAGAWEEALAALTVALTASLDPVDSGRLSAACEEARVALGTDRRPAAR